MDDRESRSGWNLSGPANQAKFDQASSWLADNLPTYWWRMWESWYLRASARQIL